MRTEKEVKAELEDINKRIGKLHRKHRECGGLPKGKDFDEHIAYLDGLATSLEWALLKK